MEDFTIEEKGKILIELNKNFSEAEGDNRINREEAIDKGFIIKDSSNILVVEPLTERARRLVSFIAMEEDLGKKLDISNFPFKNAKKGSKYSLDYFSKIIEFFKNIQEENIRIITAHDFPIKIIGEDFAFFLAPRV
ncbi:hypothetical protein LCGC14_0439180 [marine sediment metagenome]|uniref:Uncharacterized protein n=1 Tax=marine sediment metagenome TaxID=412755 RepID=A0A0F9SKW2_9ZZZZ